VFSTLNKKFTKFLNALWGISLLGVLHTLGDNAILVINLYVYEIFSNPLFNNIKAKEYDVMML